MKRYKLNTMMDRELGRDNRKEEVVQHRTAQESEKW